MHCSAHADASAIVGSMMRLMRRVDFPFLFGIPGRNASINSIAVHMAFGFSFNNVVWVVAVVAVVVVVVAVVVAVAVAVMESAMELQVRGSA